MPFPIAKQRGGIIAAACVLASAICMPSNARAAGAAYAVDTSEISAEGSCKVETWYSWASNTDLVGIANPSCVVNVGRPVEFSAQLSRSRFDDEWNTIVGPKAKTKIIPSAIGSFGLAISGQAFYDLTTGENIALVVNVPATLRLSNVVRINVNGGWQWDRIVDRHYLTYGLGVDWRTPDNVWTLTAEVFGQVGAEQEISTITQPRFQTGLRWRPIELRLWPQHLWRECQLVHGRDHHALPAAGRKGRRRVTRRGRRDAARCQTVCVRMARPASVTRTPATR